jgi:hypothetical protein
MAWFAVDSDGHVARFETGEEEPGEPEDAGMFAFARKPGDDPGRYERQRVPATPLRLDQLPEPAREAMERLPVRFAEAEVLHLADAEAEDAPSESRWWLWMALLFGLAALIVWLLS